MLSSRNAQYGSGRPRSGTAGSADIPNSQATSSAVSARPARPAHLRSRSYLSGLSPADPAPRNATTMPVDASPSMLSKAGSAEKAATWHAHGGEKEAGNESSASSYLPRIHLPGHKSKHSQDVRGGNGGKGVQSQERAHHLHLHRVHSHRHTRSEVPSGSNTNLNGEVDATNGNLAVPKTGDGLLHSNGAGPKAGGSMLTRVTTNLSNRAAGEHKHKSHHQYSASDHHHKGWNAAAIAARAGTGGRPEFGRRRASSDPRTPTYSKMSNMEFASAQARLGVANHIDGASTPRQLPEKQKPMTEVELLLYKAEKTRKEAEQNVSEADVQRLTTQLAESNVELQEQLAVSDRSASTLMRRLDDAYDNLRGTATALIDTISSFQHLCSQLTTLIENFGSKTNKLDGELQTTLKKQRAALFEEKGTKIAKLEERGKKANLRAEEMSRRLENCRTIIRNFTEREQKKKRAWKGVLVGSLWGFAFILFGVLSGFILWWYKNYGGIVKYDVHEAIALALDNKGLGSVHGHLHEIVRDELKVQSGNHQSDQKRTTALENVPDDVRALLEEIASRHNGTEYEETVRHEHDKAQHYVHSSSDANVDEDEKLKSLFDKLEL